MLLALPHQCTWKSSMANSFSRVLGIWMHPSERMEKSVLATFLSAGLLSRCQPVPLMCEAEPWHHQHVPQPAGAETPHDFPASQSSAHTCCAQCVRETWRPAVASSLAWKFVAPSNWSPQVQFVEIPYLHISNTSPSNFFLLFHQGAEINPWWITLELVIGTDWPIPAPEAGLTKPGTTQQLVAFSSKCSPQMCCRSSATRQ